MYKLFSKSKFVPMNFTF